MCIEKKNPDINNEVKVLLSFQFQDILRPNYNSVDLTEVELTDTADSEARGNDTELLFVRIDFIFFLLLILS